MNARAPIVVYRPYGPMDPGTYHIARMMSTERRHEQYHLGSVTRGEHGLSYDIRSDRPEGYEAFNGPITDADIAAIKRGIAWHEARPVTDVSNLTWAEDEDALDNAVMPVTVGAQS